VRRTPSGRRIADVGLKIHDADYEAPVAVGTECFERRGLPLLDIKILYLRQSYHFGPSKIAMYLKRYHDVEVSKSGVWRILKRLDLNRLPAALQTARQTMATVRKAAARPPGPNRCQIR
jgi:hypothetical protein